MIVVIAGQLQSQKRELNIAAMVEVESLALMIGDSKITGKSYQKITAWIYLISTEGKS
jgi:hypothetical protein